MDFLEQEQFIQKQAWGEGDWQTEPDRVYWIDEATNLDCLIVRSDGTGALCGYVGVDPSHPLFEKHCGDLYDWEKETGVRIDTHCGLTYSDHCNEGGKICHVPQPGRSGKIWWFGFDCAHSGDLCPAYAELHPELSHWIGADYRTIEYVRKEVENLASQLAAVKA